MLALHRTRQQLVKFRTAHINGLRGLLAEYDRMMPRGRGRMKWDIARVLERLSERLPAMVVETLREQWARVATLGDCRAARPSGSGLGPAADRGRRPLPAAAPPTAPSPPGSPRAGLPAVATPPATRPPERRPPQSARPRPRRPPPAAPQSPPSATAPPWPSDRSSSACVCSHSHAPSCGQSTASRSAPEHQFPRQTNHRYKQPLEVRQVPPPERA